MIMNILKRVLVIFSIVILVMAFSSCSGEAEDAVVQPENESTEEITETEEATQETQTEAEETTMAEESEEESTEQETVLADSEFKDLLTGEPVASEQTQRPCAVVINNLKESCPQEGIGDAGIIYECMVEGGITRLLAVYSDYTALAQTGSVRSARRCFLDLLPNHDALFIHAGGSADAYDVIDYRKTDNLDGVNMYLPNSFYRDEDRRYSMGTEHSLMIDGDGIVAGIEQLGYRTELNDSYSSPYNFLAAGEEPELTEGDAKHIYMSYNLSHNVDYIYDEESDTYLRYQFNCEPHIDGTTGQQLAFTNILILSCKHESVNDTAGHIDIKMTGAGEGYYVNGGKYTKIMWGRQTPYEPFVFVTEEGKALYLEVGKTAVNIVSTYMFDEMELNKDAE